MCGIAGILDDRCAVERDPLERMLEAMRHRGPDASGIHIDPERRAGFAHARLSIIDPATGAQPMHTPDGRHTLVFNGEIYNYIELKAELASEGETFRTASDTEVLLRGLVRHGRAFLPRLNGIFSLALYDRLERRLLAARDPFAVKPFYYTESSGRFLFASEIKSILAVTGDARLDPAALAEYLTLSYRLHGRTMFEGVRELPGGAWLERDPAGTRFGRHYDFPEDKTPDPGPRENSGRLRELLSDAVRLQLRSDVPVGCHLSGGLDSSLVACLARRHKTDELHTFSGAFREGGFFDETPFARAVARHIRSEHHEVRPEAGDFIRTLGMLMRHMDEPAAGPGLYPQYFVSLEASKRLKVVLGGQGGDEVFAGYPYCTAAALAAALFTPRLTPSDHPRRPAQLALALLREAGTRGAAAAFRARALPPADRFFAALSMWNPRGFRAILHPDLQNRLGGFNARDSFRAAFESAGGATYADRILRYLLRNYLRALLQVEDRVSMAVSLESRVPLLDTRIVDFSLRLPTLARTPGFRSKALLREAARTIVPPEIHGRRDKRGFPTPIHLWLARGPAREGFLALLREPDPFLARILAPGALARLRAGDLFLGPAASFNAWQFLCLELWGRAFRVRV